MAHDAGAFRLDVGGFPIQRMTFASETRYQDGMLSIDRAALLAAIAEPPVIADLEIHLAHPGESCRIVHVLDTVAPMVKVQGRSTVYPGFFGTTMPGGWPQSSLTGSGRSCLRDLPRSHQWSARHQQKRLLT